MSARRSVLASFDADPRRAIVPSERANALKSRTMQCQQGRWPQAKVLPLRDGVGDNFHSQVKLTKAISCFSPRALGRVPNEVGLERLAMTPVCVRAHAA